MARMDVLRTCAWLTALCALVVLGWWWPNRLQNPDAGVVIDTFNCLSYAPYRPGQSPLDDRFASQAEVEQDLALLATRTRAIRTYAAIDGPYEIPALAARHGLKVWQGIWLGADRAKNRLEMARAIEMAQRYPQTIERVIVGNEVLLRRDLPVAELIADIEFVRHAVKQPVAYADVSDFWDQFPQVAPHVDVVLIHLLPYWEDVPTGIGHAVDTVGAVYAHFVKLFPGRTIAIGETGWPSRGRQRRDAVPGRINEARFLRGFIALSQAKGFDYNFIEAFDQNWKYENEGIVGANWGILSADRRGKIPTRGPLPEDPLWAWHAAFSIVCGTGLCLLGTRRGRMPVCLGMALGSALGLAQADVAPVLYDAHVRLAAVVNLGGQALLAGLMVLRAAGDVAPCPGRSGADATWRVRELLRLRHVGWAGVFEDLCFLFAWTAAVLQILLVFDPRYREFPVASFAVPLVVLLARAMRGEFVGLTATATYSDVCPAPPPRPSPHGGGGAGREEVVVAVTLTGGAIASGVQEGVLNGQSLIWNACAVGLAVPLWWRVASRPR